MDKNSCLVVFPGRSCEFQKGIKKIEETTLYQTELLKGIKK